MWHLGQFIIPQALEGSSLGDFPEGIHRQSLDLGRQSHLQAKKLLSSIYLAPILLDLEVFEERQELSLQPQPLCIGSLTGSNIPIHRLQ